MNEKIIVRIKKLLALSESSNKHEAQNSLLKAQELLMKHKLSMQDIEEHEIETVPIEDKITDFTFTKAKWKGKLATLIANNLCCYCYYHKGNRTNSITFLGREDDVAVAEITLKYAIDFVKDEVKKIQRERYKENKSSLGLESDYAVGFINGLQERYEEQKEKHQEWGLVLVKPKEVVDAYNNLNFIGSINLKTKFNGNTDAYYKGEKDGKNFSISDKIASEENETVLIG